MALIAHLGLFVLSVLAAILSRMMVSEIEAWSPSIIRRLVKLAAARLPVKHRARYEEEWQGHVNEVPGVAGKLLAAAGFLLAANKIALTVQHYEAEDFRETLGLLTDSGFKLRMALQRVLSCMAALVGLVYSLPLLPFIWLAVKLDSPGPVFYAQKRVGRDGKIFYCYKFRTMPWDAEADTGATWAPDDDPRITRVGRFLRMSLLDEIPQLWCVLKGDMNLVGPRPERPEFVEWLNEKIPYYAVRHVVRPGITGWAQVQYKNGNTLEDASEKLQYDLFYIKNASIRLDLQVWFRAVRDAALGSCAE